jgi:hypothetical protein
VKICKWTHRPSISAAQDRAHIGIKRDVLDLDPRLEFCVPKKGETVLDMLDNIHHECQIVRLGIVERPEQTRC